MMTDNAKRNFSTVLMVVVVLCWSGLFYLHNKAMNEKNYTEPKPLPNKVDPYIPKPTPKAGK
jgi:hypothetical protein